MKKLAKIKYLPNNKFLRLEIMLNVLSLEKISLENLTYWNVDLQEAYYSYHEAFKKREKLDKI